MAAVKRKVEAPAIKKKVLIKAPPAAQLMLPTERSIVSSNLLDYSWLIYGERKIGKTELLAQFEDPFFMMFEAGAKSLAIRKVDIRGWHEFEQYVSLLEKTPGYCKLVVLDTGGECYEMDLLQVKKDFNLVDIRDKAWGGGYTETRQRFNAIHDRIYRLGCGFAVTAHSEIKHITPKFGKEYDKLSIQLSNQAFKYYLGVVDNICYYHYDDNGQRILTIRGDETVEAGTRCTGRFLYTDGTPIKDIPMGNNAKESYKNLLAAFNNQLPKGGAVRRR